MKKVISIIVIIIITLPLITYCLLTRETKYSVVINKNISKVWKYASNSNNAREWSVYFHHISPLPGIEDGKVGSVRRCYRRENETGPYWDEEVTQIEFQKYRQLRTYNLNNFNDDILKKAEFKVHQRYTKLSENKTRLEFGSELIGPWELDLILALLPAADETQRIFKLNLENIKAAIEQENNYQRPHAYEEHNKFDKI